MSERVFKLGDGPIEGKDVDGWREFLHSAWREWNIDYDVQLSGPYDAALRAATKSYMRAWGVENADEAMSEGLTPWWRTKLRNDKRNAIERNAFDARIDYRRALREKWDAKDVCSPIAKILEDSWGYHPPVHDGIDLICNANAPLLAICKAKVIRADAGGWWGKGAPSAAVAAKGDGIIVLRSLTDVGPFRKGLNFGYGHAERPVVKVGQVVEAGERIGTAGLANAWHVHLVVNGRSDAKGVGDRDPRPFVDYARENS